MAEIHVDVVDHFVYAYGNCIFRWVADLGKIKNVIAGKLDIVSRLGTRFDKTFALQCIICLKCRAEADPLLFAQSTN